MTLTDPFAGKRFTPGPAGVEWSISVCTRVDPETTVCGGAGGPTQELIKIAP